MNIVSLYFGRDIARHGMVSDAQWLRFAADVIGPAFPDGFTSFDATGQWRNPTTGAIEREPTKVVQIATQVSSNIRAGVDAVASAYKKQFRQLAVGVVSTTACASF